MATRYLKTVLIFIFATACEKNKECVPPSLAEHVVGTWNATLESEHTGSQELTFESNGNFKESKGLLFGTFYKSVANWKVKNDSLIVEGKFSAGNTLKFEFSVLSRSCDQITFDLEGVDKLQLTKK
jgi:hypothetical protein